MNLTDRQIACLYAEWSETFYCAGWLADGEQDFVDYLFSLDNRPLPLEDYEIEGVAKIRVLMEKKP